MCVHTYVCVSEYVCLCVCVRRREGSRETETPSGVKRVGGPKGFRNPVEGDEGEDQKVHY